MARIRQIKPGFFVDEDIARVSFAARLLFIGLWTLADRDGRLEDRPSRIKVQLLGHDVIDVDALLAELAAQRFIIRYVAEGRPLIGIRSFARHQKIHPDEKPLGYPPPQEPEKIPGSNPLSGDPGSGFRVLEFTQSPPAPATSPEEIRQDRNAILTKQFCEAWNKAYQSLYLPTAADRSQLGRLAKAMSPDDVTAWPDLVRRYLGLRDAFFMEKTANHSLCWLVTRGYNQFRGNRKTYQQVTFEERAAHEARKSASAARFRDTHRGGEPQAIGELLTSLLDRDGA